MALRVARSQDFWTGCAFAAFGAATAAVSQFYPLGSAARMGPGYFPTALGLILCGIGAVLLVKSLAVGGGEQVARIHVTLLARVLLAIVAFAALLHPLGLVLTAIIVVLAAAWAGHEFRWGEVLLNALSLALLSYTLFIWGLNQTMPVWPWFMR
jgi:hypothetical protein